MATGRRQARRKQPCEQVEPVGWPRIAGGARILGGLIPTAGGWGGPAGNVPVRDMTSLTSSELDHPGMEPRRRQPPAGARVARLGVPSTSRSSLGIEILGRDCGRAFWVRIEGPWGAGYTPRGAVLEFGTDSDGSRLSDCFCGAWFRSMTPAAPPCAQPLIEGIDLRSVDASSLDSRALVSFVADQGSERHNSWRLSCKRSI